MKNDIPQVFIITHGDLATALLEAAEKIIGKQNNVNTYTNKEDSLLDLAERIKTELDNLKTKKMIRAAGMNTGMKGSG